MTTQPEWVGNVGELVADVRDGERIGPSGVHFMRAPVAQLRALCARGVRDLTYVAWGGGLPLELLLDAGAVRNLVFCFSSLDVFGLAPRFRAAVERGELVLDERPALAFIKGLEAGGEQLPHEVLQAPLGSDLFPGAMTARTVTVDDTDHPLAETPAITLDTFLLHAVRADDAGNVEISGARTLDLLMLLAARRVLVTVEERVREGDLGRTGRGFVVPRTFVTRLALAPFGAYPTSCMPRYPADLQALQRFAGTPAGDPVDVLVPPDARVAELEAVARTPAARVLNAFASPDAGQRATADAAGTPEPAATTDELLAVEIARAVGDGDVCSIGSVSPLATVAYFLAKALWAPRALIMTSNGCYVDVGVRPMCLTAAEQLDFFSARTVTGSEDTYHWYYQRGLVDFEIVSAAQIDRRGATNNRGIRRSDGSLIRLPGQGGMADVANMHRHFFLYLTRHSARTLVERVHFSSAARQHHGSARPRLGYQPGATIVLTDLGRFEYDEERRELVLTALHPGVTFEQLQDATGFPVATGDHVAATRAPTAEELRTLRRVVDPLGIRRLEFVPSRERTELLTDLLHREARILAAARADTALTGAPDRPST